MDARKAESLLLFSEDLSPELSGADAKPIIEQLEKRHQDLLAAISWFMDHDLIDEARRLAIALAPFWKAAGRMEQGSRVFDTVLPSPAGDDQHRAAAMFHTGYLAFWMGDDERATAHYDSAIAVARGIGDVPLLARGLVGLARIALRGNDIEEARRLCREAIAQAKGAGDPSAAAGALHVLGVAAQMAGDFEEARDAMNRRIAMGREIGNLAMVSVELGNLSMVERQTGNLDRAEGLAREALEIDRRRGDEWAVPHKLNAIAAVAVDQGENARAATVIGAAEALVEAQGAPWPPDELAQYERTTAVLEAGMDPDDLAEARATGRAMTLDEAVDFALGARPADQGKVSETL